MFDAADAARFNLAMTLHNDLVGTLLRRPLTPAEDARLLAVEAELESLAEAAESAHYAR